MTNRRLLQIQAVSGGTFLAFTLLHLANTGVATLGVEAYDGFQERARWLYQNPLIEVLFLALPLSVHAAAAIERLRRSGFRRANQTLRSKLHRYSGYLLLAVIWGHILAVRGPSLFQDFHPGFAGLSFSLWWIPWLFYPYYALLALCGLYHGTNGFMLAAAVFGRPFPDALRYGWGFWAPLSAAGVALVLGIAAMGGILFSIPDPIDNPYARMWEGFGVDLER
jgi:succinate dehydrogenase/fumarate reductase cytochrome b subunit